MSVDEAIDQAMRPLADLISRFIFYAVPVGGAELPLIVAWLIAGGLFFTIYLGFINVRGFRHALDLVRGRYTDPSQPGEVTPFQALATAVSGTVGIGNIAGVAVAISLGGPGATMWLIIAGLLGMSTKFAECTLAVKFRRTHSDGSVSGGPMYYLQRGLALRKLPRLGRGLGIFYAASMVVGCLGIGNMFQSNQAAAILIDVTGGSNSFFNDKAWILGLVMAVTVALVIVGGIKSIARTTSKLVPFMAVLYVVLALAILAFNAAELPRAVAQIWQGAFTADGISGGLIGVMIIGFRRAVFSNEAGLGSAAIAHAAAKTDQPVSQGMVALLEPFIDSVVVCTLTSLVIVILVILPGEATSGLSGIEMSSRAFDAAIPGSSALLSIIATLFAFSTMLAWSYYGLIALEYLLGRSEVSGLVFKLIFLVFTVIGSTVDLKSVIEISDALVFLISIPNLVGLYFLAPQIKRELQAYQANNRF